MRLAYSRRPSTGAISPCTASMRLNSRSTGACNARRSGLRNPASQYHPTPHLKRSVSSGHFDRAAPTTLSEPETPKRSPGDHTSRHRGQPPPLYGTAEAIGGDAAPMFGASASPETALQRPITRQAFEMSKPLRRVVGTGDLWRSQWRAGDEETENYTYAIALQNDT